MFTIYKKRACYISSNCYEYVSDQAGFAIFIIKNSVFDLYYHDIENRFTNNIKIPIGHEMVNGYEVKLVNATIWIVTRINDECFVYAICVKNENEWYHITTPPTSLIILDRIESSTMLVTIQPNRWFSYSNCKVLQIDDNILKVNETNKVDFVEPHIPVEWYDLQYSTALGIYETRVILTNISHCYSKPSFFCIF